MPNPAVRLLAWVWTHRLVSDRWRSRVMWWLNPKLAAGVTAIVRDDQGRVLLVEHAFRKRSPWALPGGWMQRGESPEQTVTRELHEELGLEIAVERVVTANTFALPRLDIVLLCRPTGGTLRPSAETPRWQWCHPGAYPPSVDPYSVQLVQQCLAQCAPDWP